MLQILCCPRFYSFTKIPVFSVNFFVFAVSQAFLIMDGEDIPDFSSLKEETAYWKELSLKYKQR